MAAFRFNHVLIVGGSGMLRHATLALAEQARAVTVVGRMVSRLRSLEQESSNVTGVAVDYHDEPGFALALNLAVECRGLVDLAVVWIHDSARLAAVQVAEVVGCDEQPGRYVHVLGSAAADPAQPDRSRRLEFEPRANLAYHEVILGFVLEHGRSRWLSNAEISSGVLAAVQAAQARYVVGVVRPWSARP